MFFFIGGIQPKTVRLKKQAGSCPNCAHPEVYLKRVDQYVSLFFIPLFPIKRGVPFVACENCNSLLEGPADTGRQDYTESEPGREPRCGSCGRAVKPDFSYCPYCGKWL